MATPPALHIMFDRCFNRGQRGRSQSCRPHNNAQTLQTLSEPLENDCARGVREQAAVQDPTCTPMQRQSLLQYRLKHRPSKIAISNVALEHNATRSCNSFMSICKFQWFAERQSVAGGPSSCPPPHSRRVVPPPPPPPRKFETSCSVCKYVYLPHRHGLVVGKSTRRNAYATAYEQMVSLW